MSLPVLVLDLETWPREDAAQYVETPKPHGGIKDEQKIAEDIAKKLEAKLDRLALDVDLARIACLGRYCQGDHPVVMECRTHKEERRALDHLFSVWRMVNSHGDGVVVTFNGLRFDMPLISRRAEALSVTVPESWPPIERYRSPKLVDLYDVLTFKGLVAGKDLATYCAIRGIIVNDPLPDGGAEVGKAIADGRWEDVAAHCAADVTRTMRLAERVLGWARQPEKVAR